MYPVCLGTIHIFLLFYTPETKHCIVRLFSASFIGIPRKFILKKSHFTSRSTTTYGTL